MLRHVGQGVGQHGGLLTCQRVSGRSSVQRTGFYWLLIKICPNAKNETNPLASTTKRN